MNRARRLASGATILVLGAFDLVRVLREQAALGEATEAQRIELIDQLADREATLKWTRGEIERLTREFANHTRASADAAVLAVERNTAERARADAERAFRAERIRGDRLGTARNAARRELKDAEQERDNARRGCKELRERAEAAEASLTQRGCELDTCQGALVLANHRIAALESQLVSAATRTVTMAGAAPVEPVAASPVACTWCGEAAGEDWISRCRYLTTGDYGAGDKLPMCHTCDREVYKTITVSEVRARHAARALAPAAAPTAVCRFGLCDGSGDIVLVRETGGPGAEPSEAVECKCVEGGQS